MTPAIFGLAGTILTADERALFAAANPAGYILFGRNITDKAQVRALTDSLRDLTGRDNLPVLIDQEGGRVARMRAPIWPDFPAGATFDTLYEIAPATAIAAARANALALALVLAEVGITVDCLPVLDVRQPGTHDALGNRAMGSEPLRVAALGRAIFSGLRDGGVAGVMKHMPGLGRAVVDSHHHLPIVEASDAELAADIAPFTALNDARMGMTTHVVYTAWDADRPATQSPTVIADIIRGRIGFDGLLMTDDLDMQALSGTPADRAATALAAGCDIALQCNGVFADIASVCERIGSSMTALTTTRLDHAMEQVTAPAAPADTAQLLADTLARRDAYLALA
jgi:beta-N-acetylhexosaminidase